ncbi:hypothetical protein LXJ56_27625, partial [Escherichia coli]|nr:hypothetical protein [Escherichia coli]
MSFATFRIGAAARLVRALDRHAAAHGLSLTALGHEERAWASATFAGRRLQLTFAIDAARDGAADRWL